MHDNSSRIQRQLVEKKQQKKKQRWFLILFLFVAIIGLAGVSFVPVFSELFSSQPQPTAVPTATATATATVDARQKELQDLEKSYLIVLQREPDNPNVLSSLVETRLQMISLGIKQPADVIEPLTKLSKLSPERTEYRVLLGQSQQQAGKLDDASQTFRDILAQEPSRIEALQGLVKVLLQEKRPQAAVDILQTTLKSAQQANQLKAGTVDETAINLILGQVYVAQKNYDSAFTLYDDLIKASPKDFRPFYGKAEALKAQGNLVEAKTFFQSSAALAPEQYKAQIKAVAQQIQTTPSTTPSPTPPLPESPSSP